MPEKLRGPSPHPQRTSARTGRMYDVLIRERVAHRLPGHQFPPNHIGDVRRQQRQRDRIVVIGTRVGPNLIPPAVIPSHNHKPNQRRSLLRDIPRIPKQFFGARPKHIAPQNSNIRTAPLHPNPANATMRDQDFLTTRFATRRERSVVSRRNRSCRSAMSTGTTGRPASRSPPPKTSRSRSRSRSPSIDLLPKKKSRTSVSHPERFSRAGGRYTHDAAIFPPGGRRAPRPGRGHPGPVVHAPDRPLPRVGSASH